MICVLSIYDQNGYWPIWQALLCVAILCSVFLDQRKIHQTQPSFWLSDTCEMQFHLQQDTYQVIQVKWVCAYFCSFVIQEEESQNIRKIWIWHDTLTVYAYKNLCRSLQHIKHKLH